MCLEEFCKIQNVWSNLPFVSIKIQFHSRNRYYYMKRFSIRGNLRSIIREVFFFLFLGGGVVVEIIVGRILNINLCLSIITIWFCLDVIFSMMSVVEFTKFGGTCFRSGRLRNA